MTPADNPLLALMRSPTDASGLSLADWDVVVRLARRSNLLARLCALLRRAEVFERLPDKVRVHLANQGIVAERQQRDVRFELGKIVKALEEEEVQPILLKGAAYIGADLPAAQGRQFADIDLMVPKDRLGAVENALIVAGWMHEQMHPYDNRYYRTWMHQIPPLTHLRRDSTLDVHHTILPETARVDLKAKMLLDAAVPLEGWPGFRVLAPHDMVLHSAVHLFNEGEFDQGLRDLSDMDLLLRHFGAQPGFWDGFVPRAAELDLLRPLYYALSHLQRLLATPVPEAVIAAVRQGRPGPVRDPVMGFLLDQALRPPHPLCRTPWTGSALFALYIRAHYLRMPLYLLIPHLLRKSLRRMSDSEESE